MCIILFAINVHPNYPLIIASNRDEYLDRPTEKMKIWSNSSSVPCHDAPSDGDGSVNQRTEKHHQRRISLAGRDLVGEGTWLGVSLSQMYGDSDGREEVHINSGTDNTRHANGGRLRWAAVTNFRGKNDNEVHGKASRGSIPMDFLEMSTKQPAECFASELQVHRGKEYNGFNLLVGDETGVYYCTNRDGWYDADRAYPNSSNEKNPLSPGVHGLSNGHLDTPWFKVIRGKELLKKLCEEDSAAVNANTDNNRELCNAKTKSLALEDFHERLMQILNDQTRPTDDRLPDTGLELNDERYLSSIFIPEGDLLGKGYGTRSSTTLLMQSNGHVSVCERTWSTRNDQWFLFDSDGNTINKDTI